MDFSKRLMLLSAAPAAVLAAAALVGVAALWRAEARFADVFEKDQPLAQAVTEMYGHGLQIQAERLHKAVSAFRVSETP